LKEFYEKEYLPLLKQAVMLIEGKEEEWNGVPMLAHTHGQPASPTTLSKELKVFSYRLKRILQYPVCFSAKFGGATGNFNAHKVSFPDVDWVVFANQFCQNLGLIRQQYTTQIENYDDMAALFDEIKRTNVVLLDLCKDIWAYVSMEYFKQKIKEGEVGSSAMPHKVNPIDFENAEGNLQIANSLFEHLSMKLPVSRLQRDLTDSTATRNIGVPFAHTVIALNSIIKGLNKLLLNKEKINGDLEQSWAVVAEGLQTILRSIGYPNPYETLKVLTRTNSHITKEIIAQFIDNLEVPDEIKQRMKAITPQNYIGVYQ
jgi:adenylosuccinate lyase